MVAHCGGMRPWAPGKPFLYDLQLQLMQGRKVLDEVSSYFGLRDVRIQGDYGVDAVVTADEARIMIEHASEFLDEARLVLTGSQRRRQVRQEHHGRPAAVVMDRPGRYRVAGVRVVVR